MSYYSVNGPLVVFGKWRKRVLEDQQIPIKIIFGHKLNIWLMTYFKTSCLLP